MTAIRLLVLCLMLGLSGGAASAAESAAATCSRLAGNIDDPDFKGDKGVGFFDIDAAAAEAACRQAMKESPDDRHVVYTLGRVLWSKNDFAGAVPLFEQAMAKGSTAATNALGLMHEGGEGVTQSYAKAAEYYKKAADAGNGIGTTNLAFLYELGLGVEKDIVEAERLFRIGMAHKNPVTVAEAKNGLAWMWVMEKMKLPEAEALAKQAVADIGDKDDFSKGIYLDTLAWTKHMQGRTAEAVVDAEAAVKLADDAPGLFDRLGDIYLALGRKADARAQWEKALTLPPPSKIDDPQFDAEAIKAKLAKL